jgi:hypothetical protein
LGTGGSAANGVDPPPTTTAVVLALATLISARLEGEVAADADGDVAVEETDLGLVAGSKIHFTCRLALPIPTASVAATMAMMATVTAAGGAGDSDEQRGVEREREKERKRERENASCWRAPTGY